MSLNPAHGEVYSIQYYVINFVSDLWQVGGFLQVPRFSNHCNHCLLVVLSLHCVGLFCVAGVYPASLWNFLLNIT